LLNKDQEDCISEEVFILLFTKTRMLTRLMKRFKMRMFHVEPFQMATKILIDIQRLFDEHGVPVE